MVDEKDNLDAEGAATAASEASDESESPEEEELFTSAEYDFTLVSQSLMASKDPEANAENSAGASNAEHEDEPPASEEDSPPWAEDDTSAPPGILPPIEKPKPSLERTSGSLEDLVVQEEAKQSEPEPILGEPGDPARKLPGKDTQSVVVDMGQLNEDSERKAMEIAAQRAAFSPLESSGAMERITFSNLAAMNFPDQEDDTSESQDGSTVNLHRDQLKPSTPTPAKAAVDASEFDLENQTFDSEDPIDRPLRRPGRWLLLMLVSVLSMAILTLGWSVWNLGEHRKLLTRKPIEAIEMGLGIRAFPLPPAPKAPVLKMQKIAGALEIENIQLDWAKDKKSATVSGRIRNGSNVTHDRIELSVQLFDEMTNSITVQKTACCGILPPPPKPGAKKSAAANTQADIQTEPTLKSLLKPGEEERFSSLIKIRKPSKGEVTAKVTIYYSEVVD